MGMATATYPEREAPPRVVGRNGFPGSPVEWPGGRGDRARGRRGGPSRRGEQRGGQEVAPAPAESERAIEPLLDGEGALGHGPVGVLDLDLVDPTLEAEGEVIADHARSEE